MQDYQTPIWHEEPETEKPLAGDFLPNPPRSNLNPSALGPMYKHHSYDPFRRSKSVEPPSPPNPYASPSSLPPAPPPPIRSKDARRSRRHSFKQVHAELKIAMGVKTLLEERAKDKRRSGGVPHSQTDAPVGMSELLQVAEGLLGTVVGKEIGRAHV